MNDLQKKFLRLAVIEQLTYDQIETILSINRKTFSSWWNEFKEERLRLVEIRDLWKKKCPEINFDEFADWYNKATKKCFYCKIRPDEIDDLWKKYPKLTERNRGRKLEIERLKPESPYSDISNLVFSCYWCNNAKTDTFTAIEFKRVGDVFQEIWKKRLG